MRLRRLLQVTLLLLLPLALPAGAQELLGRIVTGVEYHAPAGIDTTGINELIALRPGQPYSPKLVRRSIERLYATEKFADIVVRLQENTRGVNVVFDLKGKQRIQDV